jgi:hypothetical protein
MNDDDTHGQADELRELNERIEDLLEDIEDANLDVLDTLALLNDLVARTSERRTAWVGNARTKGHSWAEIAASLDLTKQAAHQRYARPDAEAVNNR